MYFFVIPQRDVCLAQEELFSCIYLTSGHFFVFFQNTLTSEEKEELKEYQYKLQGEGVKEACKGQKLQWGKVLL